ncbi:MAG: stage III sporulation protein AB [Oscillospiraceae bacterium]|nr:stage III sporulation protein AB [Oscillospiraceae bacterium]
MKLIGSAIIILSLFLAGKLSCFKLSKRTEFIRLVIDLLEFIKTEINYKKTTMFNLVNNLNKNIYFKNLDILDIFYKNLLKQKSIEISWSEAIAQSQMKYILNQDELIEILKIGSWLGSSSVEEQIFNIDLSLEYLKQNLLRAQGDKNKYYKIYNNFGILSGIALVILIW